MTWRLGVIRADAQLNAGGFLSSLKSLDQGVVKFVGGFAALGAGFAGVGMIVGQVQNAFAKFKTSLDLGGEMTDLNAQTGETIGNLTVLKQAFKNAGLGTDVLGPIGKLQKALGGLGEKGNDTAAVLAQIGVSGEALKEQTATEQIEALSAGFATLPDQIERAAVARELFGKSGGKMLSLLGDPAAMATARAQVGGLAGMLEKNAPLFDKLSDAIGALDLKFTQFSAGALSIIAPQASGLADAFNSLDLTGLGVAAGNIAMGFVAVGQAMTALIPLAVGITAQMVAMRVAGLFTATSLSAAFTGLTGVVARLGLALKTALGPIGLMALLATALIGIGGAGIARTDAGAPAPTPTAAALAASSKDFGFSGAGLSSMQKAGGASIGFFSTTDPVLDENRKHTELLRRIESQLGRLPGGSTPSSASSAPRPAV